MAPVYATHFTTLRTSNVPEIVNEVLLPIYLRFVNHAKLSLRHTGQRRSWYRNNSQETAKTHLFSVIEASYHVEKTQYDPHVDQQRLDTVSAYGW